MKSYSARPVAGDGSYLQRIASIIVRAEPMAGGDIKRGEEQLPNSHDACSVGIDREVGASRDTTSAGNPLGMPIELSGLRSIACFPHADCTLTRPRHHTVSHRRRLLARP